MDFSDRRFFALPADCQSSTALKGASFKARSQARHSADVAVVWAEHVSPLGRRERVEIVTR
jgi:hypothetical protein